MNERDPIDTDAEPLLRLVDARLGLLVAELIRLRKARRTLVRLVEQEGVALKREREVGGGRL